MSNESRCLTISRISDEPAAAPGPAPFDYSSLDPETRAHVLAEVRAIHGENGDNIAAKLTIGRRLITLKELLGRFDFQPLVKAEYSWGNSTTTNYMNVASAFPDLDAICRMNIHWTALILLAQAPEAVRNTALQLAGNGTIITKKIAAALIAQAHDRDADDCGRLLDQASRALKRTMRLFTALAAVQPQLEADDSECADDMILAGMEFFASLTAGVAAEHEVVEPICSLDVVKLEVIELPSVVVLDVKTEPAVSASFAESSDAEELVPCGTVEETNVAASSAIGVDRESAFSEEGSVIQSLPEGCPESPRRDTSPICIPHCPVGHPPVASVPVRGTVQRRRSFLAALGTVVGAIFMGAVPNTSNAGQPIPDRPAPVSPKTDSLGSSIGNASKITVYQYDPCGKLVSIVENPVAADCSC